MCPAAVPGGFPAARRAGKAGALVARAVVRESVTVARAGGAGAGCRAFTAGVLGPGHPCGDDAALLGICSGTASGTAARARKTSQELKCQAATED